MIERKMMSTCRTHERIFVRIQEQHRHFSFVTKNVNQDINDRRVILDNLNLFDVNFRRINRIMMQIHSTSLSNRRFDDFLLSRRRLIESTTLKDSWVVFDDVQNLTLKHKSVQIWIHFDRNLTDNKLTKRKAKVMTYSQNRMIFSKRHNANIERTSVFDMNQIANCVLAYCIEDNKFLSMIELSQRRHKNRAITFYNHRDNNESLMSNLKNVKMKRKNEKNTFFLCF
jgi:hypothetical protein